MTKEDDKEIMFFDDEDKDDEAIEHDDDDGSLYDDGSVVADIDQNFSSSMGRLSLKPKLLPGFANYGTPRKLKLKSHSLKIKTTSPMIVPCSTLKSPSDLYSVASSAVHRDILQEYDMIDPKSFIFQNGTKFKSLCCLCQLSLSREKWWDIWG
eukprot:11429850-Ditylum_brightwellii.AAC.1